MGKLFLPESMNPRPRTDANIWIPGQPKPGIKKIAVVFYHQPSTGRILVGFPEQFPLPRPFAAAGFQKIVCRTAGEVDLWDKKIREQEKREDEMTDEQREAFEGPIRAWARGQLVTSMLNARNETNREFCRHALEKMDEDERRRKMKKESFMHIVGFEDGK